MEKEAQKLQQELHANKAVRIQYKPGTKFGRSITSNSFLSSPIHRRNAKNFAISFFHFYFFFLVYFRFFFQLSLICSQMLRENRIENGVELLVKSAGCLQYVMDCSLYFCVNILFL